MSDVGDDRRPIPDPTLLTTEALQREVAHLQELMTARLEAKAELSAQRHEMTRELVDTRLHDHVQLSQDRFQAVRRETELALGAANAAVSKAEESTTKTLDAIQTSIAKQFEALAAQMRSEVKALEEQIVTLKERQDRSEGKGSGVQASWGVLLGAIGAMGVLVSIVVVVTNLMAA